MAPRRRCGGAVKAPGGLVGEDDRVEAYHAHAARSGATPAEPDIPRRAAYALAAAASAAAVVVIMIAAVWPSPGRQARGLLVVVALVCLVGVSAGWLRVVWAARPGDPQPLPRSSRPTHGA
jgi:hypothetical protein